MISPGPAAMAAPGASRAAAAQASADGSHIAAMRNPPCWTSRPIMRRRRARGARSGHRRGARPAAVNFSFASSSSFQAIVDAARSGSLGALRRIEVSASFARWPRDWQQAGRWLSERVEGGFAREVLSHFVFATQRLTGPLSLRDSRVSWPADGRSAETALVATLSGGGIEVAIDAAVRGDVPDTNLWTVAGERGAIRMRDWYALERLGADGAWAPAMPGGVEDLRAQAGQRQLDQLAALLEGRPQTLATFDEALAVQRTIEAMLAT